MSADNYLYVRQHGGKWYVTMESASAEAPGPPRGIAFDSEAAAWSEARLRYDEEMVVEYGIRCDEDLEAMHEEKRAGQEEIARAIDELQS